MRHYDEIFEIAAARKGGAEALNAMLTGPRPSAEIAALPDSHWLEHFTRHVFQTGISWKVIDAKWDGFLEVFQGFDVGACAFLSDEAIHDLAGDTRIVRHGPKILSVRDNAIMLSDLAREHGSASRFFADWPGTDFIGLLDLLKTRGGRLGGNTGAYALRFGGLDSFVLSRDVVGRLIAEGVIDKPPTSKGARRAVQAAFNTWVDQSGRSLTEVSKTLAYSL